VRVARKNPGTINPTVKPAMIITAVKETEERIEDAMRITFK
jgi:hypothetical protein